MTLRLGIIISHPIQHFAPWHSELAKLPDIDLRVFFCCDWGLESYDDPGFGTSVKWDIPLTEGYEHEFLPIARRPIQINFRQIDNPSIGEALNRFNPDVVKVFGYARRTNWRAVAWAKQNSKPVLLYSDSNIQAQPAVWKRAIKDLVVQRFYGDVDGALYVGDNNRAYHERYGLTGERLFPGVLPIDRRLLLASVPDAASTRRIVREQHSIPHNAFVVLFSGKFIPRKRPLDLVAAIAQVTHTNVPVWCLLVGEGPERGVLEEYCRKNNVTKCVLTGFVNQSRIAEYYAASDALVVSSSYDPHPLVVTEGATFGLPTIISDRVGCLGANDTARVGVNALTYACGNRDQLGAAIETLYHDSELHRRMSAAAKEISESQDVSVAAQQLAAATGSLHKLGKRKH